MIMIIVTNRLSMISVMWLRSRKGHFVSHDVHNKFYVYLKAVEIRMHIIMYLYSSVYRAILYNNLLKLVGILRFPFYAAITVVYIIYLFIFFLFYLNIVVVVVLFSCCNYNIFS